MNRLALSGARPQACTTAGWYPQFHDPEGFSTAWSTKSFRIIEILFL